MNTIYYGNGVCTIEGSNILAVMIRYAGAIEIDDKTPEGYYISAGAKNISISPFKKTGISLNELFEYNGEFKIISAISKNRNTSDKTSTTIKRVMDYSELLDSNAEDLTVKSEALSAGYGHAKKMSKTILKQKTINNLSGLRKKFDANGAEYIGSYHFNLETGRFMSGGAPAGDSFIIKSLSNPNAIKRIKTTLRNKRRRAWRTKT